MLIFNVILFCMFIYFIRAKCPLNAIEDTKILNADIKPPGKEPEEQFIQTTFIYRDLTNDDRSYSNSVMNKLSSIRDRLKFQARVTIDNENIDCSDNGFHQCKDYPLERTYHFFIVEDSYHGAAVYSVDMEFNFGKLGVIEMSLLDALSRHSNHPLVDYASDEADREVGFVRELSLDEIESSVLENAMLKKKRSSIFIRSPFEFDLINQQILDLRNPDFKVDIGKLKAFTRLSELSETIETGKSIVVMFWSNVKSLSMHAFNLYAKASKLIDSDEDIILGFVSCHEENEICIEFDISHQDLHTLFYYNNGMINATQINIRDVNFYVEWIKMIKNGPTIQLYTSEDFENAKKGLITNFGTTRQVVTIGTFSSKRSLEFQRFQTVANILNGRYHLLFRIVDHALPLISTYRQFEKNRQIDFDGKFDDIKPLIDFITHSSIPSILNISYGFTSDIIYRSSKDVFLFVHDNHVGLYREFVDLADKFEEYQFAHLDISNSLPYEKFLRNMMVEKDQLPTICIILRNIVKCFNQINENILNIVNGLDKKPDLQIEMDSKSVHPLKWIQLEHVNKVFGHQDIILQPEPISTNGIPNPHNFDDMDLGAISGCPFHMGHMKNHFKDEL